MCKDLRFKHSAKKRAESVKLFEQGFGYKAAATILKISRYTVKEWYWVYKALGEAGLLDMGKTQTKYTFEQKLCAVRAVVDEGLTKQQAMAKYKIKSPSCLSKWCKQYKDAGEDGLATKKRGRPKGSKTKQKPLTKEQQLQQRCRLLETEVAYLKKLNALVRKENL